MVDYDVAKPTGKCALSGRDLADGEEYYAVLFETEDGFTRSDYSLEYWTGPPDGAFCYFKTRVPPLEKKKQTFVDNEVLVNFFVRLADAEQPVKLHFRFVLALILMRKRLLKYEETIRQNGNEFWQMRLVADQTVHRVLNPRLDEQQITTVSAQLGTILHSDMGRFDDLADGEWETSEQTADTEPLSNTEDSPT